jgi:hypothetical protein
MYRFHRTLPATLLVLAAGCMYSFAGGGLPAHVDTVAILALDNETAEPLLESDVQQALQSELPRSLGVRLAEESLADAVIRGVIRGYSEMPAAIRPAQESEGQSPVVQREVRITYDVEIYDQEEDRVLWRVTGQSVVGSFNPEASETIEVGKARAIEQLVTKVIEGAQSQW